MNRKKKYRSKVKKICPKHKCTLINAFTVYGLRFECPHDDCTVACWNGSTSTPADLETRTMRITAHKEFDMLWKAEWRLRLGLTRQELYKRLAKILTLEVCKTHIGYFDINLCSKVIVFAEQLKSNYLKKVARHEA